MTSLLNFYRLIPNVPLTINRNAVKVCQAQKLYSSYGSSKLEGDPEEYTKYDIFKEPPEWKFVERLIPPSTVPVPQKREVYYSGWKPQTANPKNLQYFIERSRNYQLPVYLEISKRGTRRLTSIKNISGDIWTLADRLSSHLNLLQKRNIGVQVDEVSGKIVFRGDVHSDVSVWLLKQGF